ncbi:hypothetical protein [Lacrimispora celerecrescens]|nr:hypothetical protein [Lacrimispora celerecrescens]
MSRGKTNSQEDDSGVLTNKEGEKRMCKSMTEFEILILEIQSIKEAAKVQKKKIEDMEGELKAYMKKRGKEKLFSNETNITVSYCSVPTPKFNKELFIKENSEEEYQKYQKVTSSMRLNYLKGNQA